MARNARAVAVGYPHHITQRGNNREPVFLDDQDRLIYTDLLRHYTQKFRVDIWSYCLMPNHVNLFAVPQESGALALGVGRTNQVYTRYVNRKYLRSGRVWQNHFYSCIVDSDDYLWSVARYIENNPVKAGLVSTAAEYLWSSARFHLEGCADPLLSCPDWLVEDERNDYRQYILAADEAMRKTIDQATRSGRPLCKPSMLLKFEELLGRTF
jgi:putative transposase